MTRLLRLYGEWHRTTRADASDRWLRLSLGAWFDPSGELVEPEISREGRFRRISRDGKVIGTLAYPICPSGSVSMRTYRAEAPGARSTTGSYPFTTGGGAVADRRGHFWCASTQGTRVARLAYDTSDTIVQATIDIPLMPVSGDERDDAIRKIEARRASYPTSDFDRSRVPSTKSGIAAVHVDDDGRLRVVHAAAWKRSVTTSDVFDGIGRALFRVTLPMRSVPYLPVVARGNEFLIAVADDDDVISLARYRLR